MTSISYRTFSYLKNSLNAGPISINGFGVREALLVFFFEANGYKVANFIGITESAIAFSLLGVVYEFMRLAPGGIWFAFANNPHKNLINKSVNT